MRAMGYTRVKWAPEAVDQHTKDDNLDVTDSSHSVSENWSRDNMVDQLRPDELEAFKEAFDSFDKNSDGTICTKVDWKLNKI